MKHRRILEHFGVQEKRLFINEQFSLHSKDIKNAIVDNEMIALAGDVGTGKTELLKYTITDLCSNPDKMPAFVHVRNKFKEKMTIASIINAIIYEISDEAPKRDLEARSRQVIRLVGKKHVAEGVTICVVIEEAHRMHFNTFRALKELREDEFAGVSPLFSVVLVGHPELTVKIERRKEVYWRSMLVELNEGTGWMVFEERVKYLKWIYGEAITAKARDRIASLYKVPLAMDYFVEKKMAEAFKAGMEQLTEDCFEVSAREMKEALDVSLQEIAKEAGVGKTTVHEVISGHNVNKKDTVQAALERLAEKKREEEKQPMVKVA